MPSLNTFNHKRKFVELHIGQIICLNCIYRVRRLIDGCFKVAVDHISGSQFFLSISGPARHGKQCVYEKSLILCIIIDLATSLTIKATQITELTCIGPTLLSQKDAVFQ